MKSMPSPQERPDLYDYEDARPLLKGTVKGSPAIEAAIKARKAKLARGRLLREAAE